MSKTVYGQEDKDRDDNFILRKILSAVDPGITFLS